MPPETLSYQYKTAPLQIRHILAEKVFRTSMKLERAYLQVTMDYSLAVDIL
jgi:hypothetical protein